MALVDLKSNLANFRTDFKPMDLETRFANPNSSTINIDSIPEAVSKQSKLAPLSRKLTSSLLNIDDVPGKFSPSEIYRPSRYAIQKIVNASRFNIDSYPEKFSPSGMFLPSKFIVENIINASRFNIDNVPVKFSDSRKYAPSEYAIESKLSDTITRWKGANGKSPEAVNYISDTKFGLKGFVTNFTDPNTSQFLGVAGAPLQNEFVYPTTILGNRLMKPAKSIVFPGPQNFIDDIKFGATGFTTNLGKSGLAEKSQFLGIKNDQYTYPGGKLLQGNRLMRPGRGRYGEVSLQNFNKSTFGVEQDFINDAAATGFTVNMNLGPTEKSLFKGIDGLRYTVPAALINGKTSVFKVSLKYGKFDHGFANIENQLGTGTSFRFSSLDYGGGKNLTQGNAFVKKIINGNASLFSYTGDDAKKYDNQVKVVTKQTFEGSKSSSPLADYSTSNKTSSGFSPLDHQYRKYNLREESENPFYVHSPYILRGIQRKKNEKPQRWGFGDTIAGQISSLLDIPRGGILTTVDRVLADTARIGKWMVSPKGIAWVVKQLLLANLSGGSHSKRQRLGKISSAQIGDTGIPMIASVIGNALGVHISRHGIPFLNQTDKLLGNSLNYGETPVTIGPFNDEWRTGGTELLNKIYTPNVHPNTIAQYKRVDDEALHEKLNDRKNLKGIIGDYTEINPLNPFTIPTPGNDSQADISTTDTRNKTYPKISFGTQGDAHSYFTMAYNRIPKNKYDINNSKFRDFRRDIDGFFSTDTALGNDSRNILGTAVIRKDGEIPKPHYEKADVPSDFVQHYAKDNLETRYGFGTQGDANTDLTPMIGPGSFLHRGTRWDRTGKTYGLQESAKKNAYNTDGRLILASDPDFRGDKVTAIDISSNTTSVGLINSNNIYPQGAKDLIKFFFEDAEKGKNVMPFRCTLTGLSDSFSPSWNRIDIMGRPDGAYQYSSFERSISFGFIAHATSRSEMIPMWRKLNYLASYTMPEYNAKAAPSGPFMRLTIGDLYHRCPGFLTALSYTFPDEGSWDIAADFDNSTHAEPKQLPMSVEVSVTYTIISDYRPQLMGRVYDLSPYGRPDNAISGQWLPDAVQNIKIE